MVAKASYILLKIGSYTYLSVLESKPTKSVTVMATLPVKIEDKESSLLATILICTSHVTSNDANYPEEFMEFHPSSLPSLPSGAKSCPLENFS